MQPICLEAKIQQLNLFAEEHELLPTENLSLPEIVTDGKGKGLILIGPGEHFGLHIAERFGREGFKIGLIARSEKKLSEMVDTLENRGISSYYSCADVRDTQQLHDAFEQLTEKMQQFQCLIYNVKHSIRGNGLKLSSAELTETFDVNVSGAISAIQISLPMMKATRNLMQCSSISPTIILTGGGYKDRPDANKLSLSIGKAGIHTLFTTFGDLLSYHGILLKTLVIDGVIREKGSFLHSDDVAEEFWKIFSSSSNKCSFRYPASKDYNPDQLKLPI
jgi:NAD(P)-dependent dehydrogenase (short-subunit alcohol dehydrogenase family)